MCVRVHVHVHSCLASVRRCACARVLMAVVAQFDVAKDGTMNYDEFLELKRQIRKAERDLRCVR